MPSFGASSEAQLKTCHPLLQAVMRRAILITDFSVLKGYRGEAEQTQAFESGNSKLRFPDSKHNEFPSNAVDIAPYPIDWADLESFVFLAGIVKACAWQMGIKIRWGGDWDNDHRMRDENFRDYGHFELMEGIWLP